MARRDIPDIAEYGARRPGYAETVDYILQSATHLRAVCQKLSLPLDPPP